MRHMVQEKSVLSINYRRVLQLKKDLQTNHLIGTLQLILSNLPFLIDRLGQLP